MPEHLRFCFNIDTRNDAFFTGKTACLPFTRSDAICGETNVRTQFNAVSSYVDASNVYGSDKDTADKLRTKTDGQMVEHKLGPMLPTRQQTKFDSPHGEHPDDLVSGDVRAIEQPGLASIHSLFLKEHNRIARLVRERNDKATDEDIYQVARKLVGAEIQNIVYNEFLPIVLGKITMKGYNLTLPDVLEEETVYDPHADSAIANEFATVANRFGHSLIPNLLLPSIDPIRSQNHCPLKENFFQFEEHVIGADLSGEAWQNLLVGLLRQRSPAMDATMGNSVLDFLFCDDNCKIPGGFGQDLAARNIQRARDHGIPSYSKFREFCKLTTLTDWNSRPDEIQLKTWKNLQKVYEKVDDIDAFTGGLSEDSISDGLTGSTFSCILSIQFAKLKNADRYFFTHAKKGDKFEQGLPQKAKVAVRKRRLGDIICDNMDVTGTPAFVMQIVEDEQEPACEAREGLEYEDIAELLQTTTTTTISTSK